MRYLIIFLLLFPVLLFGGDFTVKKPGSIPQPAGSIDRVSKRTANSKTIELGGLGTGRFVSVIAAEPMHFQDSTGAWKEYKYEPADTTGEYDKVIRSGKWNIAYSTAKPGKMRFERKKGWIAFDPAFTVEQVGVEYVIGPHGLKENLHLEASSPRRLAWGYDYSTTHEKEAKGKGRIKNLLNQTIAELGEFTAVDSVGNSVSLTVTYTADSLIVLVNAAGKVTVDPSVKDTIAAGAKSISMQTEGSASPTVQRSRTYGTYNTTSPDAFQIGYYYAAPNFTVIRSAYSFPMSGTGTAAGMIIDSVRYFVTQINYPTADSTITTLVAGTFKGTVDSTAFNDIVGWSADSAAYTAAQYVDPPYFVFRAADGAGLRSVLFNQAGRDTVAVHYGVDTLRVMFMTRNDYTFGPWGLSTHSTNARPPYMYIYYTVPVAPTVTAVADTTLPVIRFVGEITVTGGVNSTVRGVKYWPSGTGDTVSVADTGSYGAAVYNKDSRAVRWNQTILYKTFAVNSAGIGYSAIDSVVVDSIGTGSGTSLIVDGREVDTWR